MKFISDLNLKNKTVLLRGDLDLPLENGEVVDTTRLEMILPTIEHTLKTCHKLIIIGHLGRPGGRVVEELKMAPIALTLPLITSNPDKIEVLENLRFNPEEKANNLDFAQNLSELADVYINDAFATSHRKHASIVSIPTFLPSAIGYHFAKEIEALDKVLSKPERPLVYIIGGAKVDTKAPLIEKLAKTADTVLVGGKLAKNISSFCSKEAMACIKSANLTEDGFDITPTSATEFIKDINSAGTVVWSGPMGAYEEKRYELGTKLISKAVNHTSAYTVIGGGDTEAAATKFNAETNINHISSGGGAMLTYLSEETLPGIEAINNSQS